jgi:hypothetical protein
MQSFDAALLTLGMSSDALLADTKTLTVILKYHLLDQVLPSMASFSSSPNLITTYVKKSINSSVR